MPADNARYERDDSSRPRAGVTSVALATMKRARHVSLGAVFETALILAALVGAITLLPHVIGGDATRRYDALTALLTGQGSTATKYSLLGPIFAAPLWWLGALVATPTVGVGWFNTLVFGLGLLGLYLLLRRHVEGRLLRAFLLLLTLASMVPYHLTQFYGEVFTAVLMAVGLSAAVLSARAGRRVMGWGLVALGVANTPAALVGLAVVVGQRIWAQRKLRYALALVATLALIAGANLLQRGSLLDTGYQNDTGAHSLMPFAGMPGFSYPILLGLFSVLFSFGKGLLFYMPGLFLPMRKRMKFLASASVVSSEMWTVYTLWIGFTIGLILVYSKWWAWYGGWFWGPRFFLFACVPASFALALRTQRPSSRLWVNLVALAALALSTWVGINGVVFGQADLSICTANHYQLEAICHYTPDYSALWRPMINIYLFGFGRRFAAVEQLQRRTVVYGLFIALVSAYLSIPLLRAIARQARERIAAQPFLTSLRLGWRF